MAAANLILIALAGAEEMRWSGCSHLAGCLGLEPTPDLDVRVTLNLLFIGFQGDGNLGLNVTRHTLSRWFESFEASLPHLLVPTAATSTTAPHDALGGADVGGEEDGEEDEDERSRPKSRLRLRYRYRMRAYELGEGVTQVVHRLLENQLRPDALEPADGAADGAADERVGRRSAHRRRAGVPTLDGAFYQVDALAMEALLSSLADHLKLGESGYTLFVLNPRRAATAYERYGYRVGFSRAELPLLAADETIGRLLAATGTGAASALPFSPFAGAVSRPALSRKDAVRRAAEALGRAHAADELAARAELLPTEGEAGAAPDGSGGGSAGGALTWHDARDRSESWAQQLLADDGSTLAALVRAVGGAGVAGGATRDAVVSRAAATLSYGGERAREALVEAHAGVRSAEECLVDAWLGEGRVGFVDLSSGPFHWGPVVGGEGVRTLRSFADSHDLLEAAPSVVGSVDDGGGGEHLSAGAGVGGWEGAGVPLLRQVEAQAEIVRKMARAACQQAGKAPRGEDAEVGAEVGAEDGAAARCASLRTSARLLSAYVHELQPRPEGLSLRNGGGGADAADASAGALGGAGGSQLAARRRWERLRAELQMHSAALGGMGSLSGLYAADGASLPPPVSRFFARLGATLASAISHVFSPASAPIDGGAHSAARLHFSIYHVTGGAAVGAAGGGSGAAGGFDTERFKAAVGRLALPFQAVTFTSRRLQLSADDALASAYARARTAALVPTLRVDGTFAAELRVFLDSALLAAQLRGAEEEAATEERRRTAAAAGLGRSAGVGGDVCSRHTAVRALRRPLGAPPASREIPVFIFELDTAAVADGVADALSGEGAGSSGAAAPSPVFLDRFFPAKAADGMVLVAASRHAGHARWLSHLQCNGAHIAWDLTSPVRHAVAAAAQLVGGLLPAHVHFSEPHGRAASDWSWSVGSSALAHTSRAATLGQIQLDLSARNQIATALDASLDATDLAVRALAATKVMPRSRLDAQRPDSAARRALDAVGRVRRVQRVVAQLTGALALAEAHAALAELDAELAKLRQAALEAIDAAQPHVCAGVDPSALGAAARDETGAWALALLLLAAAAGIIYGAFVRRPARAKPKLN